MFASESNHFTALRLPILTCVAALCFACSDDDEKKPGTCDPAAPMCADALICVEQDEGDALCQIAPGDACDPDEEEPACRLGSTCVENPEEGAEVSHLCLVDEAGECDPLTPFCADGLSCAELQDGTHQCHAPVLVVGTVTDASDRAAIIDAHVIAIDEEGVAVTDVARSTDPDGAYQLEVPVVRDAEGAPLEASFTLRSTAQDYQTFPGGLRTALPLYTVDAIRGDDGWVISGTNTEITLIQLDNPGSRHVISGRLVLEGATDPAPDAGMGDDLEARAELAGVLVVAAGPSTRSAITDASGDFTIFNVESGDSNLRGYAAGVAVTPEDVNVADADVVDVELVASLGTLATIDGSVQIVNPGDGEGTSVILVVEDTFDENFARGEVPRGLRAPRTGAPDVTGAFSIDDVPDGDYVVLAAFENDFLVRDPDTNISGTSLVYITVAGGDMTLSESFKVTGALNVVSPGAELPEAVTEAPTLTWEDDSSEEWYQVVVYDAFGEEVWRDDNVIGPSGGGNATVAYGGPMEVGMYYQFRVTSWRQPGGKAASAISATEDLRGVFYVAE